MLTLLLLQYSRTHRYACYSMYPQVRCNSILHSRKRLAKVSIFTPIFRLFPLIPAFHPCSRSSYSMGFSRTYTRFIFYYKPKENLFSQIRSIGKSPLSRFSLCSCCHLKGRGGCTPQYHFPYTVFFLFPMFFIPFVINHLYKQNTRL